MGRYFFHVTGAFASEDEEGQEFPTPEAAAAEARKVALELAHNRSEIEARGLQLRVVDDTGTEVAVVTVGDHGAGPF
jgi:hypothetical protein